MLRRSVLHRASTEADPLTERISTSACAGRSELLQQRLTPRWHVLQTIRSTRRQQHFMLCDASRSPCASSCVGCLTPNREGTAEKAPSDRARHGREVHKSPARPWNGQPARLSSLERFSVRHSASSICISSVATTRAQRGATTRAHAARRTKLVKLVSAICGGRLNDQNSNCEKHPASPAQSHEAPVMSACSTGRPVGAAAGAAKNRTPCCTAALQSSTRLAHHRQL